MSDLHPRNVYVASLPAYYTDADLHKLFLPHGRILSAKVMCDSRTGQGRGFGFVLFDHADSATAAIQAMAGHTIDGTRIQVRRAKASTNTSINSAATPSATPPAYATPQPPQPAQPVIQQSQVQTLPQPQPQPHQSFIPVSHPMAQGPPSFFPVHGSVPTILSPVGSPGMAPLQGAPLAYNLHQQGTILQHQPQPQFVLVSAPNSPTPDHGQQISVLTSSNSGFLGSTESSIGYNTPTHASSQSKQLYVVLPQVMQSSNQQPNSQLTTPRETQLDSAITSPNLTPMTHSHYQMLRRPASFTLSSTSRSSRSEQ